MKIRFTLISIFYLLFLYGCDNNNKKPIIVDLENLSSSKEEKEVLKEPEILQSMDYTVLKGQELFDNEQISVGMELVDSTYHQLSINFNFDDTLIPMVEDDGEMKEADCWFLYVFGHTENYESSFIEFKRQVKYEYTFNIFLEEFSNLKVGYHTIEVKVEGNFQTPRGVKSEENKIEVSFQIPIYVPEIYHTILHVQSIHFNQEKIVKENLSGDVLDPHMMIKYRDKFIMDYYTDDQYSLNINQSRDIFHTKTEENIVLSVYDAEYFFIDPEDFILEQEFSLKELSSSNFLNLQLSYVDSLKIYAEIFGKVN